MCCPKVEPSVWVLSGLKTAISACDQEKPVSKHLPLFPNVSQNTLSVEEVPLSCWSSHEWRVSACTLQKPLVKSGEETSQRHNYNVNIFSSVFWNELKVLASLWGEFIFSSQRYTHEIHYSDKPRRIPLFAGLNMQSY